MTTSSRFFYCLIAFIAQYRRSTSSSLKYVHTALRGGMHRSVTIGEDVQQLLKIRQPHGVCPDTGGVVAGVRRPYGIDDGAAETHTHLLLYDGRVLLVYAADCFAVWVPFHPDLQAET